MMDVRTKWQLRRLAVEIPLALFLVWVSINDYGWPVTWYWIKFFAINVSLLVAFTKKLGWM